MSTTLIIAIALLAVSGLAAFGPSLDTVKGLWAKVTGGAKPDRTALVKAYDALTVGLVDLTADEKAALTTVWNALGRVK